MATATSRQPCISCNKGLGIITCGGCQQWLCTKHFIEHRKELAEEMDRVGQEYNILRQGLAEDNSEHPLLCCVDDWEQMSIERIKIAAEEVRMNLRNQLHITKNDLKASLDQLTKGFQSSRETDDYTEIELKKWSEKFVEIRQKLEKPLTIEIIDDQETHSIIPLIRLKEHHVIGMNVANEHPVKYFKLDEFNKAAIPMSLQAAYLEYKSIVGDILDQIKKANYESISSNTVIDLDRLVTKISQGLLQLDLVSTTPCFYGLPLSVTCGDDTTVESIKWRNDCLYDHWIVSNSDGLRCSWRLNAPCFQVIAQHSCQNDGFEKTLQQLEALFKWQE